jgi:hypothetical protein
MPDAEHAPRAYRLRDALQRLFAQVFEFELAAGQAVCRRSDDHRIVRRQALQARGQVGRIAHDVALRRPSGPDRVADNDQSGCNADPHPQLETRHGFQCGDRFHGIQSGTYGPFRRIFVGNRVAEISQYAVAHVARDESAQILDHLGRGRLIEAHHFARVLRVQPLGQRGRIGEVAEHDSQLPPLGAFFPRGRRGLLFGHCRYRGRVGGWANGRDHRAPAIAAELRAADIGESTVRTGHGQAGSALAAEPLSRGAIELALRALHDEWASFGSSN